MFCAGVKRPFCNAEYIFDMLTATEVDLQFFRHWLVIIRNVVSMMIVQSAYL
jgi:hypothetical protein